MKAERKQEEVEEADCGGTRTQNAIPCVTTMTGARGGMVHGILLIQGYKALPVGLPLDPRPCILPSCCAPYCFLTLTFRSHYDGRRVAGAGLSSNVFTISLIGVGLSNIGPSDVPDRSNFFCSSPRTTRRQRRSRGQVCSLPLLYST